MISDLCYLGNTIGADSDVTKHAHKLLKVCAEEVSKVEGDLEQLETEINPLLDDNALVALSYVLGKAVDIMKSVPEVRILSLAGWCDDTPSPPIIVLAISSSCVSQADSRLP